MKSIAWGGNSALITSLLEGKLPLGIYYWWQADGTTPWNQQTVATGSYSMPAIVWTGTEVGITAGGVAATSNIGGRFFLQPPGASKRSRNSERRGARTVIHRSRGRGLPL